MKLIHGSNQAVTHAGARKGAYALHHNYALLAALDTSADGLRSSR
jgi:hypothetical protein